MPTRHCPGPGRRRSSKWPVETQPSPVQQAEQPAAHTLAQAAQSPTARLPRPAHSVCPRRPAARPRAQRRAGRTPALGEPPPSKCTDPDGSRPWRRGCGRTRRRACCTAAAPPRPRWTGRATSAATSFAPCHCRPLRAAGHSTTRSAADGARSKHRLRQRGGCCVRFWAGLLAPPGWGCGWRLASAAERPRTGETETRVAVTARPPRDVGRARGGRRTAACPQGGRRQAPLVLSSIVAD